MPKKLVFALAFCCFFGTSPRAIANAFAPLAEHGEAVVIR